MQATLQISANAVPGRGGQGQNLVHLARTLAPAFDVRALACGALPGVPTTTYPHTSRMERFRFTPGVRRMRDVTTLVDNVAYDAWARTQVAESALFIGVTGQCAFTQATARRRGARIVLDSVTEHVGHLSAAVERECGRFGVRSFLHPLTRRRMLDEYRSADLIRVMSTRARDSFVAHGIDEKKLVIARPVLELPKSPRPPASNGPFRAMFVGLLEPWKGFHLAIEAFRRAAPSDAVLELIGGPSSRPVSEYLAKIARLDPRVRVRPVAVHELGLMAVYSRADVLVHPSLTDGFAYVVAEAMACGVPAIVSDATGAADLVRDGEDGFIVPAADASALADRIACLVRDRDRARAMGARARATVARELAQERARASLVPALEALL